jgi:hypothetical protein
MSNEMNIDEMNNEESFPLIEALPLIKLSRGERIGTGKLMTDEEARYVLYGRKVYRHTSETVDDIVVKSFKTMEIEIEYDYLKSIDRIYKTEDPKKICRNIYIQILEYKERIFLLNNNLYRCDVLSEHTPTLTEEEKESEINLLRKKIESLELKSTLYI